MSEIKFECSQCKQRLACDDQFSGRQIACPACKALNVVPWVQPKAPYVPQKSGMTFVPETWRKPETEKTPPPPKSGMTHLPEAWTPPPRQAGPENPK